MTNPFPVPSEVRDALEQVLAYAMPDEADHFENAPPEERDGHIYQSLLAVRRWLDNGVSGELNTVAICDLLEEHGHIAAIWCVDDVRTLRPDLSDAQGWQVLDRCQQEHDAGIGINWHVIEEQANDLFPPSGE